MKQTSLRRQLLLNSLLVVFATWFCTAAISFYQEFQSQEEYLPSLILSAVIDISTEIEQVSQDSEHSKKAEFADIADNWYTEISDIHMWYKGELIYQSPTSLDLAEPNHTGYVDTELGSVYHYVLKDEQVSLAIPLWSDSGWDVFFTLIPSEIFPLLLVLPFATIALFLSINYSLKPLHRITASIEQRSPQNLNSLVFKQLPSEVLPMISALNQLLLQLEHALENERNFTANAAHELLTPLAAIKSEVQLSQRHSHDANICESLSEINIRVDRATHTVEQLVMLSRVENEPLFSQKNLADIDLKQLVQDEVIELGEKIDEKHIDFELTDTKTDTMVKGNLVALRVLCRNLIDNAVRYTPEYGEIKIDFHCDNKALTLTIENSGKNISEFLSRHIFQRFVRGPGENESGSGLGLSIVQQIAKQHHATIDFGDRHLGTGVKIVLNFARAKTS